MSSHDCKTLTAGCYRCSLNMDEMVGAAEIERDEARAEVEGLRLDLEGARHSRAAIAQEADAERARAEALEGALQDILALPDCSPGVVRAIARDALAKHGSKP